jgi:tRNA1(Val) A37 N6-methylase TrmN6
MKIERIWAMSNAWTFSIKPIKELLEQEVDKGIWCDPYCGKNGEKYAQITNDLAQGGIDALEFLKEQKSDYFDGVIIDPPYSLRQISEHYKKSGIKITGWHTSAGRNAAIKNEVARIIKRNGKAICFGWNSMGLGKNRGFEMRRVLLVPHGGSKNDTIVTVEVKK